MLGIIFATKSEADPFLRSLNIVPLRTYPFLMFKTTDEKLISCIVAVSGIGKVASAILATELILEHGVNFIINIGICGALKKGISVGEIYRISEAIEGDRYFLGRDILEAFKCTCFFRGIKKAILVTSDRPIFDNQLKHKMSFIGDLADMEGAAIVRVASMYGIDCDILKGVSDLANNNGVEEMKLNFDKVSTSLSKIVLKFIKDKS